MTRRGPMTFAGFTLQESLAASWVAYRDTFLPDVPDPLRDTLERVFQLTFYAGAATVWHIATGVGDDTVSEEEAVRRFERLNGELNTYLAELRRHLGR